MALGRSLILKTAALPPVERLVRHSRLFRPLVSRFIAGDSLAEAMVAAEELCAKGIMVSLDFLGESTLSEDQARQAKNAYLDIVEAIAKSPNQAMMNISIKLTQCGFDIRDELALEHFETLLKAAEPLKTFVRVDMEDSRYTERTIQAIETLFPKYPFCGTVLQSYLHRSLEDTRRMIRLGARVRVVKGAYLEPPSVAFPSKAEVDVKYIEMAKLLLKEGHYPAIATHDEKIIAELKEFIRAEGISNDRFEWQMIYGIRRDLQEQLRAEGFNIRVYIPYGDQWYPYFMRRLAERPANLFFFAKSLFKG